MALLHVVIAVLALLQPASADVFIYGARHSYAHFEYGYLGLEWTEEFATCTGHRQSPIHIPGHTTFSKVPDEDESRFEFGQLTSNGSNIVVLNNGHTVQVVWPKDQMPENASVVAKGDSAATTKLTTKFNTTSTTPQRVKISPSQWHFHTRSEHVIDGHEYPLEMHIVNWVYAPTLPACGAGGCATVVGIMFELVEGPDTTDKTNEFLETIWSVMPSEEGKTAFIPTGKTLNFQDILPADHSYITYEGSLTTPPCTEGILWHVLTTPVKITRAQLHQFELAVGSYNCSTSAHKHHHRHMLSTGTSSSSGGTSGGGTTPATVEAFEVPPFTQDAEDGKMCRKMTGQNYREMQDTESRPIWFHAAPALCDPQLKILQSRSNVLTKLVYEANGTDGITLHQYQDIVSSGLTKNAGCSGIPSGAQPLAAAAAPLVHALLAAMLMCWLLLDG